MRNQKNYFQLTKIKESGPLILMTGDFNVKIGIKNNNIDCGHIANRAMKRIILKCLKCKESFSARPSDVVRRRKYVVFSARDFIVLLL